MQSRIKLHELGITERGGLRVGQLHMSENSQLDVLAIADFLDVRLIDGGDTAVLRFRAPDDREVAVLVPREPAVALQEHLTTILALPLSRSAWKR